MSSDHHFYGILFVSRLEEGNSGRQNNSGFCNKILGAGKEFWRAGKKSGRWKSSGAGKLLSAGKNCGRWNIILGAGKIFWALEKFWALVNFTLAKNGVKDVCFILAQSMLKNTTRYLLLQQKVCSSVRRRNI